MKKYIFMDIDGTLANSKLEITQKNIQAMQEIIKNNYEIIFCSGRCNKYLSDIDIKCNVSRYIISSNGSMIYDQKTNKILFQEKIPHQILKYIYEYSETKKIGLSFNTFHIRYCNNYLTFESKDTKTIENIEELENQTITQIVLGNHDLYKMKEAEEFLSSIDELEIVNMSNSIKFNENNAKKWHFLDVVLKNVNKGLAIKNFCKLFNIEKENCIAIGDHVNDLTMFNEVNIKIAMNNGCQELKNNADFITKTNDEDGVAIALEYLQKLNL